MSIFKEFITLFETKKIENDFLTESENDNTVNVTGLKKEIWDMTSNELEMFLGVSGTGSTKIALCPAYKSIQKDSTEVFFQKVKELYSILSKLSKTSIQLDTEKASYDIQNPNISEFDDAVINNLVTIGRILDEYVTANKENAKQKSETNIKRSEFQRLLDLLSEVYGIPNITSDSLDTLTFKQQDGPSIRQEWRMFSAINPEKSPSFDTSEKTYKGTKITAANAITNIILTNYFETQKTSEEMKELKSFDPNKAKKNASFQTYIENRIKETILSLNGFNPELDENNHPKPVVVKLEDPKTKTYSSTGFTDTSIGKALYNFTISPSSDNLDFSETQKFTIEGRYTTKNGIKDQIKKEISLSVLDIKRQSIDTQAKFQKITTINRMLNKASKQDVLKSYGFIINSMVPKNLRTDSINIEKDSPEYKRKFIEKMNVPFKTNYETVVNYINEKYLNVILNSQTLTKSPEDIVKLEYETAKQVMPFVLRDKEGKELSLEQTPFDITSKVLFLKYLLSAASKLIDKKITANKKYGEIQRELERIGISDLIPRNWIPRIQELIQLSYTTGIEFDKGSNITDSFPYFYSKAEEFLKEIQNNIAFKYSEAEQRFLSSPPKSLTTTEYENEKLKLRNKRNTTISDIENIIFGENSKLSTKLTLARRKKMNLREPKTPQSEKLFIIGDKLSDLLYGINPTTANYLIRSMDRLASPETENGELMIPIGFATVELYNIIEKGAPYINAPATATVDNIATSFITYNEPESEASKRVENDVKTTATKLALQLIKLVKKIKRQEDKEQDADKKLELSENITTLTSYVNQLRIVFSLSSDIVVETKPIEPSEETPLDKPAALDTDLNTKE